MDPVITSLLDTDLYKFTMWQALLHRYPQNQARYTFVCRNQPEMPLAQLAQQVQQHWDALCGLTFTDEELNYLSSLRFIKSDFVDFLSIFRFQKRFLTIQADGDQLRIHAVGPQVHVMGVEVFVLAIVNELYFRQFDAAAAREEGQKRLDAKIELLQTSVEGAFNKRHPFALFDFGTRRRYSADWQRHVVTQLATKAAAVFKGTSNVLLAKDLNLVPIGTMAHEYLQTFQAVGVRLRDFQKAALEQWVQEYRGDLGIALTDVVGMDAFLADFDLYFAKLFDGLRHDSGDALEWAEKALRHYDRLKIDAHSKRLVFSDGLDIPRCLELYQALGDRVGLGFGVGTNLTNDVGRKPLSIVMKLTECNGQPVAKLSDSPGKTLCDDETYLAYLRQVFSLEQ